MRVHSKALVAGVAAAAIALTACTSSSGGTKTNSSAPPASGGSSSAPAGSGSPSASGGGGGGNSTAGTKGTGNFASCGASPLDCNKGDAKSGGTITYTIEKTITGWNVNNLNSNTFDFVEVLDGVLPAVYSATPELKPFLLTDFVTSATSAITGGVQTINYKINPNATWSDGVPLDFTDFKYNKDTNDGKTCPKCPAASTAGYAQVKSITGSGKNVKVVMARPFADWQVMFGDIYPAHIAAKHGGVGTPAELAASYAYFDKAVPTYSAGPYQISGYQKDTSVTETPNPKWTGAVKPKLSKLVFRIITDQTQEVPALQNNEVQVIYPQPNADLVQQANGIQGVQTYLGKGLDWEHLDFNEANPIFKDVKLRTAIFTAINRTEITKKTVGQFVPGITPMGNHMYVPGQAGYTDNTTASGQGTGDAAKAKSMLTSAGYTGVGSALKNPAGAAVKMRCSFTTGNVLRQQTCQIIQSELKPLGITVTLVPLDSLGDTLGKGDYDLIIFAWVGGPYVVAGAQQIWTVAGGNDYGKNNDPAMEKLIDQASVLTDQAKIQTLMNQADKLLTADAYTLPLFQKPKFLAAYKNIVNLRDNSTSVGPPYNVQEWGVSS